MTDEEKAVKDALKKEREEIAKMVTEAGGNCSKASQGCGCYLSFNLLAQVILARK